MVPPGASRLLIVISSAGPPDSVGIYVVANLMVSKLVGASGNIVLLQSPFDNSHEEHASDDQPAGWMHDGTRPSMATIVKFGQDPQTECFCHPGHRSKNCHGEWHNILECRAQREAGRQFGVGME